MITFVNHVSNLDDQELTLDGEEDSPEEEVEKLDKDEKDSPPSSIHKNDILLSKKLIQITKETRFTVKKHILDIPSPPPKV